MVSLIYRPVLSQAGTNGFIRYRARKHILKTLTTDQLSGAPKYPGRNEMNGVGLMVILHKSKLDCTDLLV